MLNIMHFHKFHIYVKYELILRIQRATSLQCLHYFIKLEVLFTKQNKKNTKHEK